MWQTGKFKGSKRICRCYTKNFEYYLIEFILIVNRRNVMYLDDNKSYLIFGKQLNQIIMVLQIMSDKFPDVQKMNRFIQSLKDMRSYDDMLDEFIFGDQKSYPKDKRPVGQRDSMTLDEIMNDLQIRFMDERDKNNGKD